MRSRSELVANIVERRSSYLPKKIATVEKGFQARASALYNLEIHREALLEENTNSQVLEFLEKINFSDIQQRISAELLFEKPSCLCLVQFLGKRVNFSDYDSQFH